MRLPAEDQAVTANPDITEHIISEGDEFLVLACDGIWDCMTSQEVITFVREHIALGDSLKIVCEKLMENCLAPASDYGGLGCDNMTVVIVAILNGKTPKDWASMIVSQVAETNANKPTDTNILEDDLVEPQFNQFDNVDSTKSNSEVNALTEKNPSEPTETVPVAEMTSDVPTASKPASESNTDPTS